MIPSDHFVRFYNEIFKFLQRRGRSELEKYYDIVANRQAQFCLEQFKKDGFKGMFEYWDRIRIEENCDFTLEYDDEHYRGRMNVCPSLAKNLDNDAGACKVYCDHCPGWVLRVFTRAGFYGVYDLEGRDKPSCDIWEYKDRAKAEKKKAELLALRGDPDLIKDNFDTLA